MSGIVIRPQYTHCVKLNLLRLKSSKEILFMMTQLRV